MRSPSGWSVWFRGSYLMGKADDYMFRAFWDRGGAGVAIYQIVAAGYLPGAANLQSLSQRLPMSSSSGDSERDEVHRLMSKVSSIYPVFPGLQKMRNLHCKLQCLDSTPKGVNSIHCNLQCRLRMHASILYLQ